MKLTRYLVALAAALILPAFAFAASINTAPTNVAPAVGQTFTITLTADPASAKVYTVRADVKFDPSKVQFVSFALAPKWIALSQSGYDLEDNTNGSLIKTGGYPDGLTAPTIFGTATFRAIAAGSSAVSVAGSSLILGSTGQNQLSGTQGATAITVAAPAPKPAPTPVPLISPKPAAAAPIATTSEVATTSTTTAPLIATSSAAAAAAAAPSSSSAWIWLIILIIAIVGGLFWYRRRRARGDWQEPSHLS